MKIEEIKDKLSEYKEAGKKVFATSSFQTHSIVLLDILSKIDKSIPIYFINTGYHFPETISYREKITEDLGLNTVNLSSIVPKNLQKDSGGKLLFTSDPDYCCYLNKVQPVEILLQTMDVWINGVRAEQSKNRKELKIEEKTIFKAIRFHPMLDWTARMIYDYLKAHNLSKHPLELKGYSSIGCEPCTRAVINNELRDARWFGMNKTECGLNTDLLGNRRL